MPARAKQLTLPEVTALIHTLLSQPSIGEAELMSFALRINGGDFRPAGTTKAKSGSNAPTANELKQKVLEHFQCKSASELRKNKNFALSMTGEAYTLKTKDDWLKLYRRFIGIPSNERNLDAGPTIINGIDVLKHFRPWVVFGLDPKTATPEDVRDAFRKLIKIHHPDAGGDPRVAERLQVMKDSVLALMP